MSRKGKLIFGWVLIVYSFVVAGVGLWVLSNALETYSYGIRLVFNFLTSFSPILTTLTVINLLKKENKF